MLIFLRFDSAIVTNHNQIIQRPHADNESQLLRCSLRPVVGLFTV